MTSESQLLPTIPALWERIETWLDTYGELRQLRPPATETQIAAAEAELGFSLPAELRESLLRHDGVMPDAWPDWSAMRLAHMVRGAKEYAEEEFEDAAHLLPVADGGDGSYLVLTLSEQAETTGQLFFFEGEMEGEVFPSWQARLADLADGLDSGRDRLDDSFISITELPNDSYVAGGKNPIRYRPLMTTNVL